MDRHLGKPPTSTAPRFVLVDAFRFICAGWVMWIHIPESEQFAASSGALKFRLPFFVLLAIFFQQFHLARSPVGDFSQYARERVRRLYLPFLAWGAIYYFTGGIHRVLSGRPWPSLTPEFFLQGASIHLWFIPFILLIGLATYPLASFLLQHRRWTWAVIGVGSLLGIGACVLAPMIAARYMPTLPVTDPLYVEIQLLPCVPLGFVCFFLYSELRALSQGAKKQLYLLAGILVVAGFAADLWLYRGPLVQNLAAMGMVVLTLRPAQWAARGIWGALGRWGRYSFGMYAVHVFFVEGMHILRQSVLHLPATRWYDLLTLAVCIPASLLTTMGLCRYSATRWMVPTGEKSTSKPRLSAVVPLGELQQA